MIWARRVGIVLLGLAVAVILAFNLFKAQIASAVFNRVLDQRVGVDPSLELPDGLHVYLCGTGSPMPDATRAGPCLGVMAGTRAFVFDVGSGGTRNLGSMGFPTDRLEAVYLTHLHSDHIDGLGELLTIAWIAGSRTQPIPVRGPTGTQEVVDGFNAAYRLDSTYRVAHHGTKVANPGGFGGAPEEIEIPAGPNGQLVVLDEGDLKITAIRVAHAPIEPAFGYRVDYKDRSVSISGDTIYQKRFVAASKDVDVMLHEALDREMVEAIGAKLGERGLENPAKIFSDILDYHTDPEEAARAAEEAGAVQLIYYHIVPQLPVKLLEALWLGDAKSIFDGDITVGSDGLVISLPAASDKVLKRQAL